MNTIGSTTTPSGANSGGDLRPNWLRVDDAVRYSGISRSLLYELLKDGHVESRVLRRRGCLRGIRLISLDSLDRFIKELPSGKSEN